MTTARRPNPSGEDGHGDLLRAIPGRLLATSDGFAAMLGSAGPGRVATLNLQHLALADSDSAFREALLQSDVFTADGWPVQMFGAACGVRAEKVTGRWLCDRLAAGQVFISTILIVGGTPAAVEAFKAALSLHGMKVRTFGGDLSLPNYEALGREIDHFAPQLVLVCMDTLRGEGLAARIVGMLRGGWVVQVGGAVDMAAAAQPPAPQLVIACRLEWLWRLGNEPRRLARRYLLLCLPYLVRRLLPATAAERCRRAWARPRRARWPR